jgi:hypothetical protein
MAGHIQRFKNCLYDFSKTITPPAAINLTFGGTPITRVHTHCHLGLDFSDTMSWDSQVNKICTRASQSVNILKRMNKTIDRKTKLFIYKLFIRPKLEYANVVYGKNLSHAQIDSLEKVQRHALLSITRAYQHTSHVKLLHETSIEPLTVRRKYFRLCQLFKMIHKLGPSYLSALMPPQVHEVSRYPLRNSQDYFKPKIRKSFFLNSFLWSAIDDWNRLHLNIRNSTTLRTFKVHLKDNLLVKNNSVFNFGIGQGAINQLYFIYSGPKVYS